MITIKTPQEIEIMKKSCRLAAQSLDFIEPYIKPGVSTNELDSLIHNFLTERGAIPATLNYHGFPKSCCTSLNEVVCHGIPNDNDIVKNGDILNIDVTAILEGFHGDTNRTYLIGDVDPKTVELVEVTKECLEKAIKTVKPGSYLGDIGAVIQRIAHSNGYTVVREYCGHGIGREFHEDPQVLHYGKKGTGVQLKEGMTFTIEPMINLGSRHCKVLKDGWTVVTRDGKPSAQFEHTILVTKDGAEILTVS